MPNFSQVLKSEIARISRKESKGAIDPIKNSQARLKTALTKLTERVSALEAENKRLAGLVKSQTGTIEQEPEQEQTVRVTSKGIQSLRRRLGMSRNDFAKLLNTSSQTVYLWESKGGAVKLRQRSLAAYTSVRQMGTREAKNLVAQLKEAEASVSPK